MENTYDTILKVTDSFMDKLHNPETEGMPAPLHDMEDIEQISTAMSSDYKTFKKKLSKCKMIIEEYQDLISYMKRFEKDIEDLESVCYLYRKENNNG